MQQAWHECNWEVTPISCPPCATRRVLDVRLFRFITNSARLLEFTRVLQENFALKMPHFLKAMQRIYFTQPAPWLPYAFECACFMMQMEQSLNLPEMRPSDWGNLCAWFGPAGSAAFWLRIAWLASQRCAYVCPLLLRCTSCIYILFYLHVVIVCVQTSCNSLFLYVFMTLPFPVLLLPYCPSSLIVCCQVGSSASSRPRGR